MSKIKLLNRKQYERWLKSLPPDYCAFCNFKKNQKILKEGKYWLWVANLAPYWKFHTMIIPKRHFKDFLEMTDLETIKFKKMLKYALSRYRKAKLTYTDGTKIDRFLYFWRTHDERLDPIYKVFKPDHFHFHISPEKEHLWDHILDKEAYLADLETLV